MDKILGALANLGFAGIMGAAVLWFLRHLLTVTLPLMMQNFISELDKERTLRQSQHNDNRQDHMETMKTLIKGFDKMVDRIDKAEGVFANSLQATRHRLINVEQGITAIVEIHRASHEQQRQNKEGE